MIFIVEQILLNMLCASVSVGIVILLLKVFSKWIENNVSLKWKKWLYLFLALRLLLPVNMQISYWNISISSFYENAVSSSSKTESDIYDFSKGFMIPFHTFIDTGYHKILIDTIYLIWMVGFLIYLAFAMIGYLLYRHRILQNTVVAKDVCKTIKDICREIGLNKKVKILYSQTKISPMVLGIIRPVLLLPKGNYLEEELYFIMKHELIHLKCKDNLYKYILQMANAVHWFNPLVYMFVWDAEINLELFCDNGVVKGFNFDMRKKYTVTILNTASQMEEKASKYFTKFQGGKEIMKKRFQNIIKERPRKLGISVFYAAVSITLLCGVLTSCSIYHSGKNNVEISDLKVSPLQEKESGDREKKDMIKPGESMQPKKVVAIPANNAKDILEIQEVIYGFAGAYFKGDLDTVKQYMKKPNEADVYKKYDSGSEIYISCLKGLDDIQSGKQVDEIISSLEFLTSETPDSYTYLTIDLVKTKNSWKIDWYGLES